MWEAEGRWPFARDGVRDAMADQRLAGEGALFVGIGRLPAAAVADLTTWSSEHPPLAHRAILTLIEHYHSDLMTGERPELGSELATLMLNSESSPALRVELAALLRDHHLLSADLLDRLTNLDQPGPMRLFAAELMLHINPHDPDGVDVLRGLARQPNREMAVQVGAVLQSVLGLQLGLSRRRTSACEQQAGRGYGPARSGLGQRRRPGGYHAADTRSAGGAQGGQPSLAAGVGIARQHSEFAVGRDYPECSP